MRWMRFVPFILMLLVSFPRAASAADTYANYSELAGARVFNKDYTIRSANLGSPVLVLSIHGGGIERGTSELASAVASNGNYNIYCFEGLMKKGNLELHITSTNFDEPGARAMAAEAGTILSVHGCAGDRMFTYVGGLDAEIKAKVTANLQEAGFTVLTPPASLEGTSAGNICNSNSRGQGVQLELSRAQRDAFFEEGSTSKAFNRYVEALNKALAV